MHQCLGFIALFGAVGLGVNVIKNIGLVYRDVNTEFELRHINRGVVEDAFNSRTGSAHYFDPHPFIAAYGSFALARECSSENHSNFFANRLRTRTTVDGPPTTAFRALPTTHHGRGNRRNPPGESPGRAIVDTIKAATTRDVEHRFDLERRGMCDFEEATARWRAVEVSGAFAQIERDADGGAAALIGQIPNGAPQRSGQPNGGDKLER